MKFSIDKHEKYLILRLDEAYLDGETAPKLKSELILINSEGQRNIVLDCSQLQGVDESGLSCLLVGHRICQQAEGAFLLTHVAEDLEKLIKLSKLEEVLILLPSNEEAIDFIFMEEIERELKKL